MPAPRPNGELTFATGSWRPPSSACGTPAGDAREGEGRRGVLCRADLHAPPPSFLPSPPPPPPPGILCTGETYKDKVKLTFANGASLEDPSRLFNSSLDGNTRRAIDIREGEEVDGAAFKALVREAVAVNLAKKAK